MDNANRADMYEKLTKRANRPARQPTRAQVERILAEAQSWAAVLEASPRAGPLARGYTAADHSVASGVASLPSHPESAVVDRDAGADGA